MTISRRSFDKQDFLIKDLPPSIERLLKKSPSPLLNSFEFCTGYESDSAERVWLWVKEGNIYKAVFYRLEKKSFVNTIEIIGFPDISNGDINKLLKMHNAHLAVVSRMESPVKSHQKWRSAYSNVYLKEYITIVNLPPCKNEYLSQLGKKRQKQLSHSLRKLNQYFNDEIEIQYDCGQKIKSEDIIQLEFLNKERRVTKGKSVNHIQVINERQKRLMPLIQSFGLLVSIRYRGEIIGGNLSFIYKNKAYMVVTGHNYKYDELNIGNVGILKTMNYLIDNGINECNFLWGRSPFKTRFLGVEYPWTRHIISPSPLLAILWKYKLSINEFYTRCWRFAMTKLGFH